jgi:hypothetical protein
MLEEINQNKNMSTKTRDLFILNENYPLEADMYNKYSAKLSACNREEKCVSWVKYDIEGELKSYAKRVGVKLEESNFNGSGERTVSTERASRVTLYAVLAILAVLIIYSLSKKNWLLLGGAGALGVIIYKKPDIIPTIKL